MGILNFGGKSWKVIGAMSNSGESFFKIKNKWFESSEETEEILEYADIFIENVALAVYDEINIKDHNENTKVCYESKDIQKIKNKKFNKKGDRHKQTEERKQDRHVLTEERKKHDSQDRHVLTEERKKHSSKWLDKLRNKTIKEKQKEFYRKEKEEDFL